MKKKNLKLFLLCAMSLSCTRAFLQNFSVSSPIGGQGNNITTEINEIEVPVEIQTTVVVTNNNLETSGWITEHIEKNEVTAVTSAIKNTPYITIPCQSIDRNKGIHLRLPISTSVNELRRIRLRNSQFSGLFLKDLTSLSYDTYVTLTHNNIAPALVIQIDTDLDDKIDFNLAFQPGIQESQNNSCDGIVDYPGFKLNQWQSWNALTGWWQIGTGDPATDLPSFFPLTCFLEKFPSARIINSTDASIHAGGGIRLTVGAEEMNQMDFNGFIDRFIIDYFGYYGPTPIYNKILYDFEPEDNCTVWGGIPYKWYSRN